MPRRRITWGIRPLTVVVTFGLVVALTLSSADPNSPARRTSQGIQLLASLGDSTTTTTSTSTTDTTVAPGTILTAPSDFDGQLATFYSSMYQVTQSVSIPDEPTAQSVNSFDTSLNALTPTETDFLYTDLSSATQSAGVTSLATDLNVSVNATTPLFRYARSLRPGLVRVVSNRGSARGSSRTRRLVRTSSPSQLTVIPLSTTVDDYQVTSPNSCPSGAPGGEYGEAALYASQLILDTMQDAQDSFVDIASSLSEEAKDFIEDHDLVITVVLVGLLLAAEIVHDTFSYVQAVSNDCNSNYLQSLAGNTDETAYQTFELLLQVAGTANETDTATSNLTNDVANDFNSELTLQIQMALAAPAGTVPMAAMELPTSEGGYLNATPGSDTPSVDGVVSATISAMEGNAADGDAAQPMNPQAPRDLTLAEDAFNQQQFKTAFSYYRLAYQAAAQ